jgi:poly-gamma-glutamate capsule biosynthesis protein CapA/YwtB (metallophosphatase superfamily)
LRIALIGVLTCLICEILPAASAEIGPDSTVSIVFAGDLLLDRGVRKRIDKRGADHLFDGVRELFAMSDFVVANLECPVTDERAPLKKKYVFRADPSWLPALKRAGITHLSLANNHSNDQGRAGVERTAELLAASGITPVGFGKTQADAEKPVLLREGSVLVAFFASVQIPLENWMYREDKPGPAQLSIERLAANISDWKRRNPNGRAVAYLHWGWERHTIPHEQQRLDARELIEAGADVVIGHHPHVVQSIEFHGGKPIFYSVGNFVFDQTSRKECSAIVVQLIFDSAGLDRLLIHPLFIDRCVPRRMTSEEESEFIRELHGISPRVGFAKSDSGWMIRDEDDGH